VFFYTKRKVNYMESINRNITPDYLHLLAEGLCERIRNRLGHFLGLNVNWTELTEPPFESKLQPLDEPGTWEHYHNVGQAILDRCKIQPDDPEAA